MYMAYFYRDNNTYKLLIEACNPAEAWDKAIASCKSRYEKFESRELELEGPLVFEESVCWMAK